MNLGKIIKYVQMWIIATYYGYLRSARWHVSIKVTKNFGIETTASFWVKSPWPAKGNSLIHDVFNTPEARYIFEDYDFINNKGEYQVNFAQGTRHRVEILGLANQRGPVGYSQEFVTSTIDSRFVMPGTEIDPPKPKPVDNPRK